MALVRREAPHPWKVLSRWARADGHPGQAVNLLDVAVEIPMAGSRASLNVAVAGSLALYRLAGLI